MSRIKAILVLALTLISAQVWAGGNTYWAMLRLYVAEDSSGAGSVYASTQKSTPQASEYKSSDSETGSASVQTGSATVTLYAHALADSNSDFSHWASASKNGSKVSSDNPYKATITTTAAESNPQTLDLYAVFDKKITYYAQVTACVSSSGGGQVYAATSKTAGAYSAGPAVASGTTQTKGGGEVAFYVFAQANNGYEFSHWSSSDDGSAISSSATTSPYSVSVPTTETSADSPANKTVYAVFRRVVTCYAQAVAQVDVGSAGFGTVAVGTSKTAPGDYSATSATSAVQSINMQDGLLNFYVFAQPNDECEFLYWATESGGASVSQEETHQLTVTASSEDSANPTRVTYYAVFRKIPPEPVYGAHELNGRAIKENGAIKILSNTTISEAAKAFDDNTSTYFSPPTAANEQGCSWTGISFATNVIVTRIDFASNYARRMIGGAFQGANQADFSDAKNILVVEQYRSGTSTNVLEDAAGPYRYLRFIGMYGGNVSEIKFYGLVATDSAAPTTPIVTAKGSDSRVAYVSVQGDATVPQVYRIQRAMADFSAEDDYETFVTLAPQLGEVVTWRDTRKTDFTKYRIQSVNANGTSNWIYFDIEPEKLIADGPDKPTFTGDLPGFYTNSATVTIEYPVDGAEIYYTTDGSTPTRSSKKYTTPITLTDVCSRANNLCNIRATPSEITDSAYKWNKPSVDQPDVNVIRARAFLSDGSASKTDVAGTWLVGSTVNEHKLRVISLQTDYDGLFSEETGILVPGNVYKTQGFNTDNGYGKHTVGRPNANYFMEGINWERPTQVQIFDTNRTELLNVKMGIRVRGCWSRAASKKSMTCFFRKDYGTKNAKVPLFGDEGKMKFKRFLLRNGGNDWYQLGLRDAVAQSMFRGFVRTDTQGYEPSVLYINGEYWGVYNMRHGYCKQHFEEWNGSDGDVDYSKLDHESGNHFEVEEGDLVALWNTHYQMAKMASSGTLSDADFAKVEQMIDVDDLIDNSIVHIFLANRDWICGGNNGGYWRNRKGTDQRWHFVVFDTDIGMAFWSDDSSEDYIKKNLAANVTDDTQTKMVPNFLSVCFKSAIFKKRFANRYADLLNTALATTRTSAIIEREVARVEHERTRNQNRWTNMQSNYSSNLSRFKTFFKNRPANEFGFVKSHCCGSSASLVNLTVQATEGVGSVQLNSLVSGTHMTLPFTGQYFSDIPVTLTATPARGYKFVSWKKGSSVVSTDATYSPTITAATTLTATFEQLAPGEDIIQGPYPDGLTIVLTEPTVLKVGDATFSKPLTITGADATLLLMDGTVATIPQIEATGCVLTIDGTGELDLASSNKLMSCAGLVVSNGTLRMTYTGTVEKSMAVELTGSYIQYDGDVTMDLESTEQVFGFYSNTAGVEARIYGGTFSSTINGGADSATFKMKKGSNDVLLKGGEISVKLAGTGPRFINTAGKLEIDGATITVKTQKDDDGNPLGAGARVFDSEKTLSIKSGLVKAAATGAGSEVFSSNKKITISGGVVSVEASDDCFSAAENITVSGGKVHALSTAGDALDSNGNMVISGGYVFAFASGVDGEGLDVDPKTGEDNGIAHTLVISGGTVVAVGYDGVLHTPDEGSTNCYTTTSMSSKKKYVELRGEHADGSALVTTVNWNKRHANKFSLITTCPDFVDAITMTDDKPNTEESYIKKLDGDIEGVFLTTYAVLPILAEGETEPGTGAVPPENVSRFDATATYDGFAYTIGTNALVAATASAGASIDGFSITYAEGTLASAPTSGWTASAPSFTGAGEHIVWYKVSAPGYVDFLHAAKVTVIGYTSFWICDHADAGAGRTYLAFKAETAAGNGPTLVAVTNLVARGWIRVAVGTNEADLATAATTAVTLRDPAAQLDFKKGWVWVTVDMTEHLDKPLKLWKIVLGE